MPAEIDRIYGHLMDDGTTLIDLQSEIFSYIPRALASLDKEEQMMSNSNMILEQQQQASSSNSVEFNAMYNRPGGQQSRFQPRFQSRPQNRFQRPQQQNTRPQQQNTRSYQRRFCKVCQALDLPSAVFTSHSTETCHKKAMLQEIQLDDENQTQDLYNPDDQDQQQYYQAD